MIIYIGNLPIEACKNLGPILESIPTALATSDTSAPVASHTAEREFMLEILWAKNAFAALKNIRIYCSEKEASHYFYSNIVQIKII